jgi:hypothetical protein
MGPWVEGVAPGLWESVTRVAGLRREGVISPRVVTQARDTPWFESDVEPIWVPERRPGDVVIWDNLRPHPSREARRRVASAGARRVLLPPSSLDRTSIEERDAKVQNVLRSIGARTVSTVDGARESALESVHDQDILGWFQSCGLCPTQT